MTIEEAIERLKTMKPSWLEDGKGLMGDKRPYEPSQKPHGEVKFRTHELTIGSDVEITTRSGCLVELGDTLSVEIDGLSVCGCYRDLTLGFDVQVSLTGTVNGTHDAAFVDIGSGVTTWVTATVDTATIKKYASTDGTCDGLVSTDTAPVVVELKCSLGTMFNASVFVVGPQIVLYDFDNPAQGVAETNSLTCDGIHPAGGGTLKWGT